MFTSSLLAFVATASTVAAIAAPQPKITPAPIRPRQQLSSVGSASSTSRFTTTFGWYSGGENEQGTVWAPITWTTEGNTLVTSGSHIKRCTYSSSYTFLSALSSYSYTTFGTTSPCYLFTTCSEGWLVAASTSFYCVRSQSLCKTDLLFSSFGATDPYTWMYCDTTSSNGSTITSHYQTKPVARPVTVPATTTSSNSGITTTSSSLQTETSRAAGGGGKSNTGAIAGGVVGGVAVLAIAAVGVLFLLRRSRKKKQSSEAAAQAQPFVPPAGYTSDKPQQQFPEQYAHQYPQQYPPQTSPQQYNPHHSMVYSDHGSEVRPPNSPTPMYTEANYYRTELPANTPAPQTVPEHKP
ncbi:hypothetical protein B0J11DRAFT_49902 [Dendryphion nanum]|uniref:Transmembrane protein n=1 Tax=Dendryphion nanum TaxID=256645 RepID=A0A9P9DKU5_9PLEO|nr:hypothetical protein B0J11DRAFT_49902 [Dendryphion nanum]